MDKVIWCDRGWYGVRFGFCPSEKAWNREMKRLGVEGPAPYPSSDGRCSVFQANTGHAHCILVTISERIDDHDPLGIVGLIVHEATHVWQHIRQAVGEHNPSAEIDAYAMQNITMELMDAYSRTRLKEVAA